MVVQRNHFVSRRRFARRSAAQVLLCAIAIAVILGPAFAGEAVLKNGIRIEGKPVPVQALTKTLAQQTSGEFASYPILMMHTGLKRYFLSHRQVVDIDPAAELSKYERFDIPQRLTGRKLMLRSIGSFAEVTPFDEFGRRRLTLKTPTGPVAIVEGVTRIDPRYLKVEGITHLWEHGIATTSVAPEILDAMIRKVTDPANPDHRRSITRFYMQAQLYRQAAAELDGIVRDFPELKDAMEPVSLELRQLQAQQLIGELKRRQGAGQHELAYQATRTFPVERMSAVVLKEVRGISQGYEDARDHIARVVVLLGDLQSQLPDPDVATAVAAMRSVVIDGLDFESLPRLQAFLNLEADATLNAGQKLALAYSGWMLGSANAITDLPQTLRLWQARFLVLEYLRSRFANTQQDLLAQLQAVEGIGPDAVIKLIPLLPPPIETPDILPGAAYRIEVNPGQETGSATYHVLLPPEYSSNHRYPAIVSLRAPERTAEEQLLWWGGTQEEPGQSQRHGYIVIVPDYADPDLKSYDFDVKAHDRVIAALRDARKRFSIDSDRVILSGHGMGGDAAFDIGMSRPDEFAGVIPICGVMGGYSKWYWENAEHLPMYVVGGELDRETFNDNSRELNRMLRYGYDIVFTEYIGRGYESYYEEIHKLFEWMGLQRRTRWQKEVDARVLRSADNHFDWISAFGLPKNVLEASARAASPTQRVTPMNLTAEVKDGADGYTVIYVTSGATNHTIWLSPELVDFDKRLQIRAAGRQKFNDFLRPDIGTILEDLRTRGDRQKLRWVKLEI